MEDVRLYMRDLLQVELETHHVHINPVHECAKSASYFVPARWNGLIWNLPVTEPRWSCLAHDTGCLRVLNAFSASGAMGRSCQGTPNPSLDIGPNPHHNPVP